MEPVDWLNTYKRQKLTLKLLFSYYFLLFSVPESSLLSVPSIVVMENGELVLTESTTLFPWPLS